MGTIVVVMLIVQPFIGLAHHLIFRRKQKRTVLTFVHIWYGRALILLGMINGGLGLQLANNTRAGKIVYSVIAGISGTAFLGLVAWSMAGKLRDRAEKPSATPMTQQAGGDSAIHNTE